ncbi:MAG TPA: SLBB domain-containing protein, partial [Micromonosporaceae bacterium]|nr:SLBB domain-containing protein [Micromonosporaceae bacterium]
MSDDEILVQRRLRRLWDEPVTGGVTTGGSSSQAREASPLSDDAPAVGSAGQGPPSEDPGAARPLGLGGAGAFDPGRRGVRALAAVAAVVVLAAAGWAWWSRPQVEAVPAPVVQADPPMAAAASTPTDGGEVVVAVAGRVRRPGLVRLPAGARVADALEAAGGVLPGTDPALLNLARRVTDGELIVVGVTPPPGTAVPVAPNGTPGAGAPGAKINLNTATASQLDTLPGVGPVLAQ